ncbi:Mobile element protein [Mycobacterium tuberculosis]|nr:Mobile element protein [Mycobacterium tuberculosis]
MSGGSSRRYPPELRERAVRMVAEIRGQHDSEWAAISEVARLLGVGCAETVRKWVRQAQVDAGARPGTTTDPGKPWRSIEDVELATARWVDWFNHRRLYQYCGDVPPVELEAAYYAQRQRPAAG